MAPTQELGGAEAEIAVGEERLMGWGDLGGDFSSTGRVRKEQGKNRKGKDFLPGGTLMDCCF